MPLAPVLATAQEKVSDAPVENKREKSEVAIAIHDSHGVSYESAKDGICEVILFMAHTHIHLKITNAGAKPLTLWRPGCPEGDGAMRIEFRELNKPDEVFRSGTMTDYTAGSGIARVFDLAPDCDLIVNVDFLGDWTLPIAFAAKDGWRDVEMRAVYEPAESSPNGDRGLVKAWGGKAVSPWRRVRMVNRTEKALKADRSVK